MNNNILTNIININNTQYNFKPTNATKFIVVNHFAIFNCTTYDATTNKTNTISAPTILRYSIPNTTINTIFSFATKKLATQ